MGAWQAGLGPPNMVGAQPEKKEETMRMAGKPKNHADAVAHLAANKARDARIVALLSDEPVHIDTLAGELELGIAEMSYALAILTLDGVVECVGGQNYAKKS